MARISINDTHSHHDNFFRESKADFDAEINSHPPNESTKDVLVTIKSFMILLNGHFLIPYDPMEVIEDCLHHIWYMVLEVGKIISARDSAQESLALTILYFKELDTLEKSTDAKVKAKASNGIKIWAELPHFASDLLARWHKFTEISGLQRVNFANFTGNCFTLGIGSIDTTACVLWLMREALESKSVPVAELVPACSALSDECGHKFLMLCIKNGLIPNQNSSFSNDDSFNKKLEHARYSLEIWLFWRRRFQELSRSEDKAIVKEGKKGFDSMIGIGREMGYNIPGEKIYWERVFKLLAEELKKWK